MPRYYVDTFNQFAAYDEDGQEYADRRAVQSEVCRTLAEMMRDEQSLSASTHLRADVRDANGARVMTASLLMVFDDTEQRARASGS